LLLAACLLLPIARPWRQETINVGTQALPGVLEVAPAQSAPAPVPAGPRFTRGEIALAALAAGALVRLAWLAVGLWRLRRYRRHSAPLEGPAFQRMLWSGPLDLRLSEEVSSPVTFGFRKPVILLPAGFPHLDAAIQEAVLTHECLHVRRRDWLFTVMEEIVRAAFWFHPAIWWLLGEVQLAREQAVDRATVEMTKGREEYVDALLAIAGAQPRLDLAPAPLFLRKRHLKQRVVSILKEVRMSKTHSLSALAAGVCILAAACWLIAGAFPLAAAPQVVADGPGVSVDLGGSALLHRPPVQYPEAARAGRVEGTVMLEVTVDSAGNPIDARVVSGPQELRKAALQSVLQWHFAHGSSGARQVSIAFRLPAESGQPEAAVGKLYSQMQVTAPGLPNDAAQAQAVFRSDLTQEQKDALTAKLKQAVAEIAASQASGAASPAAAAPAASQNSDVPAEMKALQDQMSLLMTELRDARTRQDHEAMANLESQMNALSARQQAMRKITGFKTSGLSEQGSQDLLGSLPVHAGDAATTENLNRVRAAAQQFDEHLSVGFKQSSPTEVEVQISAPGSEPAPRIVVGANGQEAKLVKKVVPMYPPEARAVRIQGAVVLSALIGKDGTIQELRLVSGHPMLAPAAMEAVKQWQYAPTLLNGEPVEVSTQVTVSFTLQ